MMGYETTMEKIISSYIKIKSCIHIFITKMLLGLIYKKEVTVSLAVVHVNK